MPVRSLVVAAFIIIGSVSAGSAEEHLEKVPFLFSADEKVRSSELSEEISRSDALRTDAYLSAPMTRLEYILTKIEARLNEQTGRSIFLESVENSFEKSRDLGGFVDPEIEGRASFYKLAGKVMISYSISELGRPRRAMKETCDESLSNLKSMFPYKLIGYLYHNTLLGVLWQEKDASYYAPVLQKLAENFVLRVSLTSQSEKGQVMHFLACQQEKDGETVYQKWSFRLD